MSDTARELAAAARLLVNASIPLNPWGGLGLDREQPFWVAARNMRAVLSVHAEETGVDGEQDAIR